MPGHGHSKCRAVGCRDTHCVVVLLRDVRVALCGEHAGRAAKTRARSVRGLDFPLKPHMASDVLRRET